jgi:hypothetical protein
VNGDMNPSAKVSPTAAVRWDDPEAADLIDAAKLLGPARMVLDRCAEGRDGARAEAADMAQRIADLIGHSVSDESPHALVELVELREARGLAARALTDCLLHLAHLGAVRAADVQGGRGPACLRTSGSAVDDHRVARPHPW